MSKIIELRNKRNTLWEQTKAFLEDHRDDNGLVEASAVEQYNKMAADVKALGDEILYEAKKEEPDKEEDGASAEPDDNGPVLEAQLYSTRQMGLNILNRLRENEPAAEEQPETRPPTPVIGLDGKTEDGAVPYQILRDKLEFLK